jgi:hypothetical protein
VLACVAVLACLCRCFPEEIANDAVGAMLGHLGPHISSPMPSASNASDTYVLPVPCATPPSLHPPPSLPCPGITNFLPNVPGTTTCRVCCLPRQQLAAIRNISISPDAFAPWPYNVSQMLNWALEPADEDMLQVGEGREGWLCGFGCRRDSRQGAGDTAEADGVTTGSWGTAGGTSF